MTTLEEVMRLQKRVERFRRQVDEAAGAKAELMNQLRVMFECDSLKEARGLLKEIERKVAKDEQTLEKLMGEFEEKYGDQLK